jgi:hypothetical protein
MKQNKAEVTEWIEFNPEIHFTGSTAPSGERKATYRRSGDYIEVKINFETQGVIKGFQLFIDQNKIENEK